MRILKYLFCYIFVFALLYVDGINNENFPSIGQLWKVPLLLFILIKVFFARKDAFIKFRLGYAFSKFSNADILINPLATFSNVLKFSAFPLLVSYLERRLTLNKAMKIMLIFSQGLIFSFLPFALRIIKERHEYVGADLLMTEALIGPFNNAHTSSICLSVAIVFLCFYMFNFCENIIEKFYNTIIIVVGCVFLYQTYVRTGYAMLAVGLFVLFSKKQSKIKSIIYGILIVVSMLLLTNYAMEQDETFNARMTEQTGYNSDDEINGSGRLLFWVTSLNLWYHSENISNYLLGYGMEGVKEQQFVENGLSIFSHNGFIDALAQNGIIGLSLFLLYYIMMIYHMRQYKNSQFYLLFVAWLFLDITFQIVQGGIFVFYDFMAALIVLLPKLDAEESCEYESGLEEYEFLETK